MIGDYFWFLCSTMSDSAKSSPAHSFKGDLFDEVPTNPDQTVIDGWLKFRDQKKVRISDLFWSLM